MSAVKATQQGTELPQDSTGLADRTTRLLAAIVDGLVISAVMIPLVLVISFLGLMPAGIIGSIIVTLIGASIFFGLNFKLLEANGQTIGKKLVGIKIVGRDDQPVAANDLIVKRYLPVWGVCMIPILGALIALVNALLIFRENQACGHDEIAQTKVVKA